LRTVLGVSPTPRCDFLKSQNNGSRFANGLKIRPKAKWLMELIRPICSGCRCCEPHQINRSLPSCRVYHDLDNVNSVPLWQNLDLYWWFFFESARILLEKTNSFSEFHSCAASCLQMGCFRHLGCTLAVPRTNGHGTPIRMPHIPHWGPCRELAIAPFNSSNASPSLALLATNQDKYLVSK
jgi:hypothetical protein